MNKKELQNKIASITLWDKGCNEGFKRAGGFKKGIANLALLDNEGKPVLDEKGNAVANGISVWVTAWHSKRTNGNISIQFGDVVPPKESDDSQAVTNVETPAIDHIPS